MWRFQRKRTVGPLVAPPVFMRSETRVSGANSDQSEDKVETAEKHKFYLSTPLELCYPVCLGLPPRYNYKRETTTLKFEPVSILTRFSDYVSE